MSNPHYVTRNYDAASSSRDNLTSYSQGYGGEDYSRQAAYKEGYGSYPPAKEGYNPARQRKAGNRRKWWIIGAIVLVLVIVGAVLGGVLGTRNSKNGSANNKAAPAQAAVSTGTPTLNGNGVPVYPSSSATGTAPSVGNNAKFACGSDPWTPNGNYQGANVPLRPNHPRLFAPAYQWECLPQKIQNDPYLAAWNASIFANATIWYNNVTVAYEYDGGPSGSGILDPARRVQMRIKAWAYAWRMTNDTQWVTRAWQELYDWSGQNASFPAGTAGDNWNSQHFLDVAELTLAYAYAYDWMYSAWSQSQLTLLRNAIVTLGLEKGLTQYSNNAFWLTATGNWNCVCNGGLTGGALAILDDDTTGTAAQILAKTIPNVMTGCAQGVGQDGTWQETSDYWYFGNQCGAQMASSLMTATGSDQGFFEANPSFNLSGYYHMTSMGFVEKFNWGDCGPNKFTATANPLFLYASHYNIPMYALYQRDQADAADALSMFWYDPNVQGDWWENLELDHHYNNQTDAWAMMRGSWTDNNQIYAGIKAGSSQDKQTHSDLDAGDFVFDALGQRWAGDLCQSQYLNTGYFSSEAQNSDRWLYYRCRTEGQNTLIYNWQTGPLYGNQLVSAMPPTTYGSTGDAQTSLAFSVPSTSATYFVTDLSSAYGIPVSRGMRLLNGRRQILLQDEIQNAAAALQWRMHTNATITMSNNNQTANLALGGQSLQAFLSSPGASSNLTFTVLQPVPFSTDPALPSGGVDLPNPGVSVLAINIPAGTPTVEVLFNPQWSDFSSYSNPKSVPLNQWSLTSHN